MQEITLEIKKADVYGEVAKTTAYIGAKSKQENGKTAFDQVFVTDADQAMLERFYEESAETLTNLLKRFVSRVAADNEGNVAWTLQMSDRSVTALKDGIASSATSFVVNSIICKWCEITASDKAREYADNAAAMLASIKAKVFYKTRPKRTNIY